MEIRTVLDLLQHYPRRYHDRTKRAESEELKAGDEATVFAEALGTELLDERGLVDRTRAYRGIHRPEAHDDHRRAAERLKFDEFVRMQVGLVARKRALAEEQTGIRHAVDGHLVESFHGA